MANSPILPKTNDLGFYEMRFESVGGLGANLAGQILAEALVLKQGFNGAHFSSYGSEKKGSPVKSYIRLCAPDREVRSNSPIEHPHLLAVFHQSLLMTEGTTAGLFPDSIVVVNSTESMEEVRHAGHLVSGTLGVVDATAVAVEFNTRINAAMLGAICRVASFIDAAAVKEAIAGQFQSKYPKLVDANLKTFDRAYEKVQIKELAPDPRFAGESSEPHISYYHALGYANAPIGGVILNPGNTVHKDLSASRQGIFPLYHRDRCIDCGLCTQTCPDYVFVWEKGRDKRGLEAMVLKGPNLQYCKGCLKCVKICPVNALTEECEKPESNYTGDMQLYGPPEALVTMSHDNDPAKWPQDEGNYWRRVS